MANSNIIPNATCEFLPSFLPPKPLKDIPNEIIGNISEEGTCVNNVLHDKSRCDNYDEVYNVTSNTVSFDEILRDLIETSKNHMNQIQTQSLTQSENTGITPYQPEAFSQNSTSITANFPEYYPFPQATNFCSPINPVCINYSNDLPNGFSTNDYEHLIETVYDDVNGSDNLQITIAAADSTHTNQLSEINCTEDLKNITQILPQQTSENVYPQQTPLPPFCLFQTPTRAEMQVGQNENGFMGLQTFDQHVNGSIILTPVPACYDQSFKYYNPSEVKYFCPKILSNNNNTVNQAKKISNRNQKTFSNTMPPPFSVSSPSAFSTYRKKNQKRLASSNVEKPPQSFSTQQSNQSQNTITLQSSNVFSVSEDSIHSGQPEWVLEKMYISSDTVNVRPPLQTKNTIEKESMENAVLDIDFSSLDTSNIIIPLIQPKGPAHKKRKQNIVVLECVENIDFEDEICANKLRNKRKQSVENENSEELNKDINIHKSDVLKKLKLIENNTVNINKSDNETEQLETHINANFKLSPQYQNNNLNKISTTTAVEHKQPVESIHLKNEDFKIQSLEIELLQNKLFKCNNCDKLFKTENTLNRHVKEIHYSMIKPQKKNLLKINHETLADVPSNSTSSKADLVPEKKNVFMLKKLRDKKIKTKETTNNTKCFERSVVNSNIKIIDKTINEGIKHTEKSDDKKTTKRKSSSMLAFNVNDCNIIQTRKRRSCTNVLSYKE